MTTKSFSKLRWLNQLMLVALLHTLYVSSVVAMQCHSLLRWCPGKDCNMVFSVRQLLPKRVVCKQCSTMCWWVMEEGRVQHEITLPHCTPQLQVWWELPLPSRCEVVSPPLVTSWPLDAVSIGCDDMKLWLKKCKDDSETANYIACNTKDVSRALLLSLACVHSHSLLSVSQVLHFHWKEWRL